MPFANAEHAKKPQDGSRRAPCVAIVLLYTRVGILAGTVAVFVLQPYDLITSDFDAWFAPYGVADMAILLALAGYGFWVSLAGRPIFNDMLAAPRAEG